ncbi:MAG TPA: hypothetical protein VK324_17615, partial [Tepidisphaeraceae bacterium]|nr:hypothetical protein [Tepidisphaeraceae bacterium]
VAAARAALTAQQAAFDAAKAATETFNTAVDALAAATADIIQQVRTKANVAGPGVYALAKIPAPALPGPVGRPGTPSGLLAALKPNGSVELTWRANNPAGCTGVVYHVYRKVEATGDYAYLGGAGQRKFVDQTVPAGVPAVLYQIQGIRSTGAGDAAEFVVNFGVSGGGASTASVGTPNGRPARIAA